VDWVAEAARRIDNAGGELATPADVRAAMHAVEMGDA
jgi:hypothetical protein